TCDAVSSTVHGCDATSAGGGPIVGTMRYTALALIVLLAVVLGLAPAAGCNAAGKANGKPVTFETDIRPILEQKCQPCHFRGGKMYARLPFDQPQTIVKLGTKLFTRIKEEPQRQLILRFIAAATKPA